jgi:hypothetical protein
MRKPLLVFLSVFTTAFIIAIFTFASLNITFRSAISNNCHDSSINYDSYTYCMYLIENKNIYSSHKEVWILKQNKGDTAKKDVSGSIYGHLVSYDFTDNEPTSTKWSDTGLEIETKDGTKLFVPKVLYIGGR